MPPIDVAFVRREVDVPRIRAHRDMLDLEGARCEQARIPAFNRDRIQMVPSVAFPREYDPVVESPIELLARKNHDLSIKRSGRGW